MVKIIKSLCVLCILIIFTSTADADYTTFTPSGDTQIIYVSSSLGNDANDGLSEGSPVATIAHGKTLLRVGYPDWLLLKKGDTWLERLGGLSDGNAVAGRSASEPALISSYGTGARPVLQFNSGSAFTVLGTTVRSNYVAIVGLDFYNAERDPASPSFDLGLAADTDADAAILSAVDWYLIEDNVFRYIEVTIQAYTDGPVANVTLRNNIFREVYSNNSFSSCLFTAGTTNLLVEGNVFNHCGWSEDPIAQNEASIFDRAAYLCCGDGNTVYRGNIDYKGGSGGVQQRSGGTVEDSLFIKTPTAITLGSNQNQNTNTVPGLIRNNVILDGHDINGDPRAFGIVLTSIEVGQENGGGNSYLEDVEVYNNIITMNRTGTGNAYGITVEGDGGILGLSIRDNIIYDWRDNPGNGIYGTGIAFSNTSSNLQNVEILNNIIQQPTGGQLMSFWQYNPAVDTNITFSGNSYWASTVSNRWFETNSAEVGFAGWNTYSGETDATSTQRDFVDPDRNLSTYMDSLGIGGGEDEFMVRASAQSKDTFDARFTSYSFNTYMRDGFTIVGSTTTAPVLTFTVSSSTITNGSSTTLTWSTTDATSCTSSNGWTGARATSSSLSVSPTATTTYTLTCTGAGGSDVESVTVAVSPVVSSGGGGGSSSGGGGGGGSSPRNRPTSTTVSTPEVIPVEITASTTHVQTTDRVNFRTTPGGVVIGQKESGTSGTISFLNPVFRDGYSWVYVDFGQGQKGFVAQEFLKSVTPTQVAAPNKNREDMLLLIKSLIAQVQYLMTLLKANRGY